MVVGPEWTQWRRHARLHVTRLAPVSDPDLHKPHPACGGNPCTETTQTPRTAGEILVVKSVSTHSGLSVHCPVTCDAGTVQRTTRVRGGHSGHTVRHLPWIPNNDTETEACNREPCEEECVDEKCTPTECTCPNTCAEFGGTSTCAIPDPCPPGCQCPPGTYEQNVRAYLRMNVGVRSQH
ncbi:uncharacterized protein LOC144905920 [Branchiostoma floridae x Branchiostoma belcheri]